MCELLTLPTECLSSAYTSHTHCSIHNPVTAHSLSSLYLTHSSLLPLSLTLSSLLHLIHSSLLPYIPPTLSHSPSPSVLPFLPLLHFHSPSLPHTLPPSLPFTYKALPPSFSHSFSLPATCSHSFSCSVTSPLSPSHALYPTLHHSPHSP